MCERVWRITQVRATKQELAVGSRVWLAAASRQNDAHVPSVPEAEASHQLLHYRTKVPGWLGHLLAAWTPDLTQLRGQTARTPCLAKHDFSHSFSPYYIYTLIPMIQRELQREFWERNPREFWERNPREKQDWLIHNLYLRDSLNSSTLFLSIVKSLRGSLPKFFSHHTYICKKAIWCLGSS